MLFNRQNNEEGSSASLPTKVALTLRIIVALYVLYMAYGLKDSFVLPIEAKNIPVIIAAVIFVFASLLIIYLSGRDLISGRFQGGALDASSKEDNTEDTAKDVANDIEEVVPTEDGNEEER